MPKELSKETIERIDKEAESYAILNKQLANDFYEAAIICQKDFISGAQSEALRSLEEIEKLKEEIKSLKYWNKEKEIEVNSEQISIAVTEAEMELEKNHKDNEALAIQKIIDISKDVQILESKNKELVEALNPFKKLATEITNNSLMKSGNVYTYNGARITVEDLQRVLESLPNKEA